MKIDSRRKGATGERQFCKWLAENLDIMGAERNLEQVRSGGADVITEEFCFEVKRVENLDIAGAWRQCSVATKKLNAERGQLEPVLAFRKNGAKWSFAISAKHIGLKTGFMILNEYTFKNWVNVVRSR